MILKIAWLNIWRNKVRSLIVMASIAVGLWASVFIMGFYKGMMKTRMEEVINSEVSHIQIHQKKFVDEDDNVTYVIPDAEKITEEIRKDKRVKNATSRIITNAIIQESGKTAAVKMIGIDPSFEGMQTGIDQKMVEGEFFSKNSSKRSGRTLEVVIGQELANKLQLAVRKKFVASFTSTDSVQVPLNYRIVGIYKTANKMLDERNIYVKQEDIAHHMGGITGVHEIAILLNELGDVDSVTTELSNKHDNLLVQSWIQVDPMMKYMTESMDQVMGIIVLIILLALVFGIVNTMLMAVLERVREFGMLMAIGMNRKKVFSMIMLETVLLALVGGPVGVALGWSLNTYFKINGLDISAVFSTMEEFGFSTMVYPELEMIKYISVMFQIIALSILASIYPALKAIRLNPSQAIRKI